MTDRFEIRFWPHDDTGYFITGSDNNLREALKIYMALMANSNDCSCFCLYDSVYDYDLECDEVGSLNLVYLTDKNDGNYIEHQRLHIDEYMNLYPHDWRKVEKKLDGILSNEHNRTN